MSKKTPTKRDKIDKLKQEIEQGLHPMQHADIEKRKKSAEAMADKIINKALSTTEHES